MDLSYGKQRVGFEPDPRVSWKVIPVQAAGRPQAEADVLPCAIEQLLAALKAIPLPATPRLLLVVPDHTRRCRLDEILAVLLPLLRTALNAQIDILIANGSHVPQPEAVARELVGDEVYEQYRVRQHDARDESALYRAGTTSRGTPVWLNRMAEEADYIITIGGILFHYFAGFGGGPKMLLPGIAGLETVRINHRRTIDPQTGLFHRDCQEGNITTNPVFVDLAEVVELVTNVISLQVVLDDQYQFIAAEAGPILPVHKRLCDQVRRYYGLPLPYRADVVIASTGGHPADVNLIQSHKSIHHAFQAVMPGGVLVLLAQCAEGIGSKYFLPYFDAGSAREIARRLMLDYQINGHTALALRSKAEACRIILVSQLEAGVVEKMGITAAGDFAAAWEIARNALPADARGYIMPNAAKFVPLASPEI